VLKELKSQNKITGEKEIVKEFNLGKKNCPVVNGH